MPPLLIQSSRTRAKSPGQAPEEPSAMRSKEQLPKKDGRFRFHAINMTNITSMTAERMPHRQETCRHATPILRTTRMSHVRSTPWVLNAQRSGLHGCVENHVFRNEGRADRIHSFGCRQALLKGGYLLTVLDKTSGGISSHAN